MIYTAVLVACLALKPEPFGCRPHQMLITAGANPITAYVEAQSRAARWLAEHPELQQLSLTIRPGRSA